MKKSLKEELERIHSISYGKKVILEDKFIDSLLNPDTIVGQKKVTDDPKKADLLNNDPEAFFNDLQNIKQPLTQEESGSYEWHKEVETFQIALELLGYDLPIHGVDGLFGPETAAAVKKFKEDNSSKSLNEESIPGIDEMVWNKMPFGVDAGNVKQGLKWSGHNTHIHFGFTKPEVALDVIEKAKSLGLRATENPYTGKVNPVHVSDSFHYRTFSGDYDGKTLGRGLDVSGNPEKMEELFNYVSSKGSISPSSVKISTSSSSETEKEVVTPEMANLMYEKLKAKGVTKEELAKYTDFIVTSGSADMTDLDLSQSVDVEKYSKICDAFIQQRPPNLLHITGKMMASAAQKAFIKYHKYVPPELALAQLAAEGGIGNPNPNSTPIATNNPFDVGNTELGNTEMPTVEIGVQNYYDLIAKSYLGHGKRAADLLNNFVNKRDERYAGAPNYEKVLTSIAKRVNKLSKNLGISS
jgi:hypothetical protein